MATKKLAIQRRTEIIDNDEQTYRHVPATTNALKIKLDHLKTFEALTPNQEKFFEMYRGGGYFMGLFGSPGVGKTFLALYRALEEVLSKDNPFKQIVVVRSMVQLREIGHLPGSLEEKQEIYELPYKEVCYTLFGRTDAWDRLKEQGYARFISTTAIRGISIDDSIIIVDANVYMVTLTDDTFESSACLQVFNHRPAIAKYLVAIAVDPNILRWKCLHN